MALRNFVPTRNHLAQYGDQITIAGWFDVTKTTGAVGSQSSGRGWSVAKTGGGTKCDYTITFEGPMYSRLSFVVGLEDNEGTPDGATTIAAIAGPYSALTQKVFLPKGGSVAAEVDSSVRVHFIAVFRTRNAA